ncbi:O-antigen ligase family protein [Tautonia plasticadhaerens]|uniref:O-Antigen ligase n=1 Tax=Tautonia plasticadhaerens TaxID=2527974 RepID=A0A518GVS8_9BACT|nr:O-antigen ligase family protein [Tautonia plasticadhaerens]QDV32704.1 O-Antigen ligase [Tautonia plasticadhaerens]
MGSRAGKTRRPPITTSRSSSVPVDSGQEDSSWLGERIRRIALGLTAALVVARAYWPAEGMTELETGQQLPWTFALLATATLAVTGAMLGRSLRFRFSWADAAIVGLIAAVGVSASQALDRRVAINLAWQWAGVGLAYVLLRNLPRTRAESWALAGILAATAAAVSAYAVYQVGVELPELRRQYERNPERVMALAGVTAEPGSPEYRLFADRLVGSKEPYSTFALANSLGGYVVGPLVLGLGVLLAGLARRFRGDRDPFNPQPTWSSLPMAALPVLLLLVVLLLTKSRSAFLGLVVGGAILAVGLGPKLGRRGVIGGALGSIVAGGLAAAGLFRLGYLDRQVLTEATRSLRFRFEYWVGAWRVLTDGGAWLAGLGPGNFRPEYRLHKLVEASEDVADPHNLLLEVWVVAGIAGLFLLVLGLGLVLWNLLGPARRGSDEPASNPAMEADPPRPASLLAWGGLGGWLAVLMLGDLNLFADDNESLLRWLVLGAGWGLAVGLAGPLWARVPPSGVAFGAAVVAIAVNLLAAGGIGYAPVSCMLWGLAAVGLNLRDDRPAGRLRELPGLFPPFVAAAVLSALLGTFYGTVSPYWRSQALMNRADAILADHPNIPRQEDMDEVARLLDRAIAADAYATRPYLALAELELLAWLGRGAPPEDAAWNRVEEILTEARTPPRSPLSLEVRVARLNIAARMLDARRDLPSSVQGQLRTIIADAAYTIAELNPTSALAHAQAAEALAAVDQFDRAAGEAERALELDALIPHTEKKLSGPSRERLVEAIPEWRGKAEEVRAAPAEGTSNEG